jgi:hypothetical protein
MLEARVCRHCGARFTVRTVGYCARDHQVMEADPQGQCSRCGGQLADVRIESELLEDTQTRTSRESEAVLEQQPGATTSAPGHARRRSRPLVNLLALLILIPALYVLYADFYHKGPPIPQLDRFFANVHYELKPPEPIMEGSLRSIMPESVNSVLGEGFYIWELTNTSDFAWPGAYVSYGETHTFGLERVDPGETVGIWNVQLRNRETGELEAVKWEQGQSVELRLYIDFSDEDTFPARVKKLLRMSVERYRLGGWTRRAEGE